VLLPLGDASANPTDAAGLGALAQQVGQEQALWAGPSPALLDVGVKADADSVTATWTFDRPGALIPVAALLAGQGGYPVKLSSEVVRLPGGSPEGPLALAKASQFAITFPIRNIFPCRYVATGEPALPTFTAPFDVKVATEISFLALSSSAPKEILTVAGTGLTSYLSSAVGDLEPFTNQRLPFSMAGDRYDLAAAHALLTQSLSNASNGQDLPNPLLQQVQARVDWYTWRPWIDDEEVSRRGGALASVALALRPRPDDRLSAAMLEAGLSAQRGLDRWKQWRGEIKQLPVHLETMEELRKSVFGSSQDPLFQEVSSPVRYCSAERISIAEKNGKHLLGWFSVSGQPGALELFSPLPLKFGATQNLKSYRIGHSGSIWIVHYAPKDAGACAIEMVLPSGASLPAWSLPVYEETSH
jgi:hypothetical protein